MQTALATPTQTDRARVVPPSPPFSDQVIQALKSSWTVVESTRARVPNGSLALFAERRASGAVALSVLQSGSFSSDRDVMEALEGSLARRGYRVRFRFAREGYRRAGEELIVLPPVRGSL